MYAKYMYVKIYVCKIYVCQNICMCQNKMIIDTT